MKWIAGKIDNLMIRFYVWRGDDDKPCTSKIQVWARRTRRGDGYEATIKAKEVI